jgi:aryl sulfotransferase
MAELASEQSKLPARTRLYQSWIIDSLRWNFVRHRPDDIVIATSYKAGTTWMQGIIGNLIFHGEPPAPVAELSPFLEARFVPLELVLTGLEAQTHRRFIKTHLPLDGLPFDPLLKYVYVGRDPRDVFVSLWNHHSNYADETVALFSILPGRVGDLPPRYTDIHDMWRDWVTKASFAWEADGYPYWSHLRHAQSYWNYRHLPNIIFVHYADLLADLEREMRRVAAFLQIAVPDAAWPEIVRNCTFEGMKSKGEKYAPNGGASWKGGAQTFFNKGTNGRWREVLTREEIAQYEKAAERAMTPDCRRWLENGGPV